METQESKLKAYRKSYYEKRKKEILEQKKIYYKENRRTIKSKALRYYHENKESICKSRRKNIEKYKAYQKKYQKNIYQTKMNNLKRIVKAFRESEIITMPQLESNSVLVNQFYKGKLVKQFEVQK